ncbi:MAG: HAMP domain-containing histidine kinase [Erysipelotrichia bacterium]|nr:HAMP domain-containing histidine kinase [Erysipelotrichia bacterium]NCC54199.1 HAMP domain-containing histidine kinase [Erysipelotrichia bacterium]
MIVLLWLFQVVFLDNFYRSIKIKQIKETTHDIANNFNEDSMENFIKSMSENSDYCIRIINMNTMVSLNNTDNKGICGLLVEVSEIKELYQQAKQNNNEVLHFSQGERVIKKFNDYENRFKIEMNKEQNSIVVEPSLEPYPNPEQFQGGEELQTMTYGIVIENNNTDYFVLVNSRITIVSEIAETIRTQLLIITVILIMIALLLAFFISSRISKPIIKTNESAKYLAEGKFDVKFEGKGYLEIEELNDTLNYASHELSKVENLRNELIANMSHDLRTPLTMIAGYGEIMRDLPGENTPENVQVIIDECHRLTALVNDILDLSKLQSKTQSLNMEVFNITSLIKDITNRMATLLKNEQYQIMFDYKEDVFVCADQVKMSQVIYNLIVNAIHYAGEDHQVIIKQIIKDKVVRIEVIDHGEGIESKNLPYVWDRYYKIDKVHKRASIGSGLGLSIVKGVLELHKAVYGVTSKVNEGTTFYFEVKKEEEKPR